MEVLKITSRFTERLNLMKKFLSSLVAFSMLMLPVIPASANFEQPQSSLIEQHYEVSKEEFEEYDEISSEEPKAELRASRLIGIAIRILVFSKRIDYILDDDTGRKVSNRGPNATK